MGRVAAFREPGLLLVEEREDRPVGPRDVLLEVEACGICGSDLGTFRHGHYVEPGQVMGHEICARVVRKGASIDWLDEGDRAVVRPLRSCGECAECSAGEIQRCAATAQMSLAYGEPGGFSDTILLTEAGPEEICPIPDEVGALDAMWCEPLAVAVHALRVSGFPAGTPIMVIGGGSVGLCLVAAARALYSSSSVVIEPQFARREAARHLGAQVAETVLAVVLSDGAIVFDTSGSGAALAAIVSAPATGIDLTLVGLGAGAVPGIPRGGVVRGSFGYHAVDFLDARDLIVEQGVHLSSLVTRTWPLAEIQVAFETTSQSQDIVKAAIAPAHTERQR